MTELNNIYMFKSHKTCEGTQKRMEKSGAMKWEKPVEE